MRRIINLLYLIFFVLGSQNLFASDIDLDTAVAKANKGDVVAMNRAGELTRMGLYDEERFKSALAWFEKAVKAGNSDGLVNIGLMYDEGYGFKEDPQKAAEYFQKAVNLKNTKGMYHLASAYRNGRGVAEDKQKAKQILQECAELGDENCKQLIVFLKRFE